MKIATVSELILSYLAKDKRKWYFGGELERMPTIHKPSTISRELRNMAENNIIYKDYKKVGRVNVVIYKYKKPL